MPGTTTQAAQNVVALQASLLGLGFASTGGLGQPVNGSRNEIWQCHGYDELGQPVMLYVKLGLPTRSMLVEALAAQIAAAIGLKSPPAYLCQVQPHHVGRPRGERMLVFASAAAGERGLARPLRNLETLLSILSATKVADLSCVFDEWIGNDVRSPSDILICPEQGPIFIDHEAALPPGIDPAAALTNWLAGRLLEGLDTKERKHLLDRLRRRSAALHRLRLDDPPGVLAVVQGGSALYAELVLFLQQRLEHLDRLLSERALPEQRYLALAPNVPPKTPHATL
ncbi:hypothetical protein ACG02S_07895 [Roseateles sp. DC23W]|uniref:Aminoglycoside phosphotransferase domain-containing protein n=1 Tax=Pelomonas dachongensis TaxID=3299029 RepID=A0ABW7EP70_9BURK